MNHLKLFVKFIKKWALIALVTGSAALAAVHTSTAQPVPAGPAAQPQAGVPAGPSAAPMADIHDIKALVHLGRAVSPWVYGAIAAAVLALAGLVYFLLKRRRENQAVGTPLPLPPEAVALAQLDRIKDSASFDGRLFYFNLSAVLREYMHGRYELNAPEMTTEELLPKVDPLGLPDGLSAPLKELFLSADPIKYAGAAAVKRKMESDLAFAYAFVETTTPAAPPASRGDGGGEKASEIAKVTEAG